ncbi:MAG: NADH:flavin oxidoreductase [Lachnospiraceae bacterium]|nr:NADH:flavin oxidoreductase [Lachnospiraceae bacterium]
MAKAGESITIHGKTLKNRLTMAPTVKFDYAGADGKVTDLHIQHYAERAKGGVGLICVEATAVTPGGRFGENHMGLWEDAQIEGHKAITQACHDENVVALIQLNHTGITANPLCGEAIGPSAVKIRDGGMSREMSLQEIHAMQDAFVSAAVRAKEAGYDGVQLHGCHSYLINQFLALKTNLRTDEYGGSPENRARFASEIIARIREVCGKDFLISVRTAGADPDLDGAIRVAEEYVKAGCDYLQVSSGIGPIDPSIVPEGASYNDVCALGVYFHEHFRGRVPVSCVNGLLTPEAVNDLLEKDLTDTVDLGRAVLADPDFPKAVLDPAASYVKCFACPRCQYGPGMPKKCPALMKRMQK